MIGEVINAKDYSLKPKATIQQTGKTGFNTDAIEQLKIDENKAVVLAPDTQEKHVLYMATSTPNNSTTTWSWIISKIRLSLISSAAINTMTLSAASAIK